MQTELCLRDRYWKIDHRVKRILRRLDVYGNRWYDLPPKDSARRRKNVSPVYDVIPRKSMVVN